MTHLVDAITGPWPWYVAGPPIGLFVPLLLWMGNRQFGISGGLRSMCAALLPARAEFFRFDWTTGSWNLAFIAGIVLGGAIAVRLLGSGTPALSDATRGALSTLGISQSSGLAPPQIFSWSALLTVRGCVSMVVGGLLVGFGTAYGGGCTSGHGVTGLAALQLPSLLAVLGMFVGGVVGTFLVLPLVL